MIFLPKPSVSPFSTLMTLAEIGGKIGPVYNLYLVSQKSVKNRENGAKKKVRPAAVIVSLILLLFSFVSFSSKTRTILIRRQ